MRLYIIIASDPLFVWSLGVPEVAGVYAANTLQAACIFFTVVSFSEQTTLISLATQTKYVYSNQQAETSKNTMLLTICQTAINHIRSLNNLTRYCP